MARPDYAVEFRDAGTPAQSWHVVPRDLRGLDVTRATLGRVWWYGPLRGYVFDPEPDTIYEAAILSAVAAFCEARTRDRVSGASPEPAPLK